MRVKLFNPHVCGGRGGGNFNAKTSVRFLYLTKKDFKINFGLTNWK